jgi:hypothetical protein
LINRYRQTGYRYAQYLGEQLLQRTWIRNIPGLLIDKNVHANVFNTSGNEHAAKESKRERK